MNDQRLADVAEDAELAMWAVVAKAFPESTGGDFPPGASIEIREAIRRAIKRWHEWNVEGNQ